MLKLEIMTAAKGDCFLVHYGSKTDPKLMLFDGGPKDTWNNALRKRLEELKGDDNRVSIEMLVVTHIDDDHIRGILDLTDYLVGTPGSQRWIDIKRRWFNSFTDLTNGVAPTALDGFAAVAGTDQWADFFQTHGLEGDRTDLILSSVKQGDRLHENFIALGLPNNEFFDDHVIGPKKVRSFGQLPEVHVIGPLQRQLADLKRKWHPDLTEAEVAAYLDKSIPNLSSIAVLIVHDGTRILMTGDARGDLMLEGLKQQELLDAEGRIKVDILKLPHHGSDRNVDEDFFDKVSADIYVISADGTHNNPDKPTLEWLVESRDTGDIYQVVFSNKMKTNKLQNELEGWLYTLRQGKAFTYSFGPEAAYSTTISF